MPSTRARGIRIDRSGRLIIDKEHRGAPIYVRLPLITMLDETPQLPYPITWEEQDRLFTKLPARLARVVLFVANTGLRESNVCRLKWDWEVRSQIICGNLMCLLYFYAARSRYLHCFLPSVTASP
jgi:integrase